MNRLAGLAVTAAFALAGVAVTVTFTADALVPFSGFAAGLLKAALAVAAFWAFDRYVLPGDAREEVIERRNVAYALMLVALAILIGTTVATAQSPPPGPPPSAPPVGVPWPGTSAEPWEHPEPTVKGKRPRRAAAPVVRAVSAPPRASDGPRPAWVSAALREVGTVEHGGPNRGDRVAEYLRTVGIATPAPWCAAVVRWSLDRGGADVVRPDGTRVRTGVATGWLQGRGTIPARDVERGLVRPPRGAVVVWRNGNGWTGHAAVLDWWDRRCGETVEGNTSSGRSGSQRDGDGVWARTRCVSPGAYFRIVGFVPVVPRAAAPAA